MWGTTNRYQEKARKDKGAIVVMLGPLSRTQRASLHPTAAAIWTAKLLGTPHGRTSTLASASLAHSSQIPTYSSVAIPLVPYTEPGGCCPSAVVAQFAACADARCELGVSTSVLNGAEDNNYQGLGAPDGHSKNDSSLLNELLLVLRT